MLKTVISATVVMLSIWSGTACAEATTPALQFSVMSVKNTNAGGIDRKINTNTLKKGIFVTVVGGWSTTYQKTTELVKTAMKAKGIKVVDKPEDAEIGIQFVGIAFDMDEVETNVDAGINKEHLVAAIGSAIYTGGASLIGEMWHPSTNGHPRKVTLFAKIVDDPTVSGRGKIGGNNESDIGTDVIYQSNQDGANASTAAFVAYIDRFIDDHFVLNAASTPALSAASAVAPAQTAEAQMATQKQ